MRAMRRRTLGGATAWLVALLGGAMLVLGPRHATAQSTYRVEAIPVEAAAADAVAARDQAIEAGQREGLRRLFQSLVGAEASAPEPAGSIDRFVQSYEIASEQVGATTYRGAINVTYRGPAVREALRGAGVGFIERPPPPTLLVPAVARDGGVGLWWEADAWRAALGEATAGDGPIRLLVPLGDGLDIAGLTPAAVAAGDEAAARAIGERYGAPNVVLVLLDDARGVELRNLAGRALPETSRTVPAPADPVAAATAAVAALRSALRAGATAPSGPPVTVTALVMLGDLASWVAIRDGLAVEPAIRRFETTSFSRAAAELTVTYVGEVEQLREALGRRGITLTEEDGRWLLQRAGVPVPGPL